MVVIDKIYVIYVIVKLQDFMFGCMGILKFNFQEIYVIVILYLFNFLKQYINENKYQLKFSKDSLFF